MVDLLAVPYLALLTLGGGAALFGLISLADGVRFHRRVLDALERPTGHAPPVTLLVPVRGIDPALDRTIAGLMGQRYQDYRVVFLTDPGDEADAYLRDRDLPAHGSVVQAEVRDGCSGKIAALLTGLDHLGATTVVAFADSDVEVDEEWLTHLVAPLENPEIAATTGYRWYFQDEPGLGAGLQAAWNSAAGNVMFHPRWGYLWGGAYAVRREVLERVGIRERWARSLSDDMTLTRAVREHGHNIAFVPRATVANRTDASVGEVMEWTNRQSCMALLYAPGMARLTLPYGIHVGAMVLAAVALLVLPPAAAWLPGLLLLAPVYLGLVKNAVRRASFRRAMPAFRDAFSRHRGWFFLGALLLPLLMLHNVRQARRMRRFEWRGRVYVFDSPEDIRVLDFDDP